MNNVGQRELCYTTGLRASWLNAWLASIGIAVLVPESRLSWTAEPEPCAVFHHPDLMAALTASFPDESLLASIAIARQHPDDPSEFPRKVTPEMFARRAHLALPADASLSATVTDMTRDDNGLCPHSPFDASVPKGLTVHDRLMSCRSAISVDPSEALGETLAGQGRRVGINGLGFDYTRLFESSIPAGTNYVDPVVEVLAFVGLTMLPIRSDGSRQQTRGWSPKISQSRRGAFTWPAWSTPLGVAGIDALLDQFWAQAMPGEVTAVYGSVAYQPKTASDTTRGYASERIS